MDREPYQKPATLEYGTKKPLLPTGRDAWILKRMAFALALALLCGAFCAALAGRNDAPVPFAAIGGMILSFFIPLPRVDRERDTPVASVRDEGSEGE